MSETKKCPSCGRDCDTEMLVGGGVVIVSRCCKAVLWSSEQEPEEGTVAHRIYMQQQRRLAGA